METLRRLKSIPKVITGREYIEKAAYYIWLNEGKPEGKEQEHWDRAANVKLPMLHGRGFFPAKEAIFIEINESEQLRALGVPVGWIVSKGLTKEFIQDFMKIPDGMFYKRTY